MTHHIPTEDNEVPYTQIQSTPLSNDESNLRMLLIDLEGHMNLVSRYVDEKHSHKRNVLAAAIDLLNNKITKAQFDKIKENNPLYNKAFWESETEKLVDKVLQISQKEKLSTTKTKTETETEIFKIQAALISQINHQLVGLENKSDEKHVAKRIVLQIAKDVIDGKESIQKLTEAIEKNPRYKEAMFGSKTEHLVAQALMLHDNLLKPESESKLKP